ncbi:MAG: lytic transglycosylase domain-containing protein [Oscillospiraceae bacterium]|jgi:soluble lytic murein transglycosylase-like protein|nr:lytic transglycosylase domain-containing protein [Oscillospiraceae bacterium]
MAGGIESLAQSKVYQAFAGVESRLKNISSTTGISFSSMLVEKIEAQKAAPVYVYNDAYAAYRPQKSEEIATQETANVAATANTDNSKYPETYDGIIRAACEKYGVSFELVKAVIRAESSYNTQAVSSAGAMGLMQLMPGTAADLGVDDAYDPEQNIDGGVRYLKTMLNRFNGDARLALAAYNWGPGAVSSRNLTDLTDPAQLSVIPTSTASYITRIFGYVGELGGEL